VDGSVSKVPASLLGLVMRKAEFCEESMLYIPVYGFVRF
jgi:hypothetical protein